MISNLFTISHILISVRQTVLSSILFYILFSIFVVFVGLKLVLKLNKYNFMNIKMITNTNKNIVISASKV